MYVGTAAAGESTTPINSYPITTTSYTATGLTVGQAYYFKVVALNSLGPSASSNEAEIPRLLPASAGGYWLVGSDGGVFSFGDAAFHGSDGATHLNAPIVGMAPTPTAAGTGWSASDGGVFSFGDAAFHGSEGAAHLNAPIVGMAATADGGGYWLVASRRRRLQPSATPPSTAPTERPTSTPRSSAWPPHPTAAGTGWSASDGGVFSFGDATFHGSHGAAHLNAPIVGMAATPSGNGYWLVGSDGGVFTFGDATFHGSEGATHLNAPIVGMAPTPSGAGYGLVGGDGGMFTFGDAGYVGSTGSFHLNAPIVGMGWPAPPQ